MKTLTATFPSLQEELMRPLLRYARSRVRNAAVAEDAVSATLLAALESGMQFDAPGSGLAWMFGVLRHKIADELRKLQRETPSDDENLGEQSPPWGDSGGGGKACPEDAAVQRERVARLLEACNTLSARQREALVLKILGERETSEVCDAMGIEVGNMWVLLHRARQHLKRQLAP